MLTIFKIIFIQYGVLFGTTLLLWRGMDTPPDCAPQLVGGAMFVSTFLCLAILHKDAVKYRWHAFFKAIYYLFGYLVLFVPASFIGYFMVFVYAVGKVGWR